MTMNDLIPDGKEVGSASPNGSQPGCCQPAVGNGSSCCNPPGGSRGKGKMLISLIVIIAAIAVGAYSLARGLSTQTGLSKTATNCSPQCCPASSQSDSSCPNPSQSGATNCDK